MARSVKGLGANLFENLLYKRLFTANRRSQWHTSSEVVGLKENCNVERPNSQILKSSCLSGPSAITARLLHTTTSPRIGGTTTTATTSTCDTCNTPNSSSCDLHHHHVHHTAVLTGRSTPLPLHHHHHQQQVRHSASFSGVTGLRGGALGVRVLDSQAAQHSGTSQEGATLPEEEASPLSPHQLTEADLVDIFIDIRKELQCPEQELQDIACYYFDGQGKVIRPVITVLVARALNGHVSRSSRLLRSQLEIAKVTEMIHTASLLHDDVLDRADTRRGKPSVTRRFGQKKSVMAGDYILSVASTMLARLDSPEVTIVLAQVLADLVQGEFMQLGSKEKESERFSHYLAKTFKKTASLIAYSCQAVAILGGADEDLQQVCFQYGRNVGIAFQLVDDLLDFVASSSVIGKPTSVDLKLGMATAPVLFACEKFPELNPMILRRFSEPGDVQFAFECVHRSDGLQQTKLLARQHCLHAIQELEALRHSEEKMALIAITDKVLNRIR